MLLLKYGIATPKSIAAKTPEEAFEVAKNFGNYIQNMYETSFSYTFFPNPQQVQKTWWLRPRSLLEVVERENSTLGFKEVYTSSTRTCQTGIQSPCGCTDYK